MPNKKPNKRPVMSWDEWTRPRSDEEMKQAPRMSESQINAAIKAGEDAAAAYDEYTQHRMLPVSHLRYT